ncbi:MAG: T9SS type A sorting domain-containing protein [Bacteroidota bacterium]|nr:T9SS type A sorting domain-containing protein [Bacteroidota bacterium]MDP4234155.1 T9SS type A sorting domain-containing protein [Bacteroidota bacterium]MDP4244023.1 T9SS type A sorting domain-containing protein [Bacteroidota bacterium]MDP4287855.1 T9SS type A sorting domain-containing protein [Bacteroidota bacterium]
MKAIVTGFWILLILASSLTAQTRYRRGNPTSTSARLEYYVVDSDDDSPLKPTYHWVDTSWVRSQKFQWHRVTGFSNNDDASVFLPKTYDSASIFYFRTWDTILPPPSSYVVSTPNGNITVNLPGGSICTNGTICLSGKDSSAYNVPMDDFGDVGNELVAALWSDWELLPSGTNASSVWVRPAADTFIVSYYNLGLKGTNGQVRATFQTLFNATDSTITFEYKSFDGSWNGVPAATIIQRVATIGLSSAGPTGTNMAVTYLHRGYYNATNPSSTYALNLHNGLGVRFVHVPVDAFLVSSILTPPKDHYELTPGSSSFTPQCSILNMTDTTINFYVRTVITNITTGSVFYLKNDSILITQTQASTYTAPPTGTVPCGNYKLTFTIGYPSGVSDAWPSNNTMTRYFSALNGQTVPFREEFDAGISPCTWTNVGVQALNADSIMTVPMPPIATGLGPKAAVLNRLDGSGNYYLQIGTGGDTLISAPIDLSTAGNNVYLSFHYQRGLSTDSSKAGILSRLRSGPEVQVRGALGGLPTPGDSLVLEGLLKAGSTKWNPPDSAWKLITTIPGGFDVKTQTFMVKLDAGFLSDHFRLRFRVKAYNSASPVNLLEDADNWAIDGLHVEPFVFGKTELEPVDVDLGNGNFTHIPRDLSDNLVPKVRILNRGDGVPLGAGIIRLVVKDALGRYVYDKTRTFDFSYPLRDSVFSMPNWDLHGTQGGVLTAIAQLEGIYFDSYNKNDTNVFYKTMYIDDSYAIDDGGIDTTGTVTTAPSEWYYKFTPVSDDTLKGVSMYYVSGGASTNWSLTISGGGLNPVTKSLTYNPTAANWFTVTLTTPVALAKDSTYTMHFVWNYGPKTLGGDGSQGLAYYTVVDSSGTSSQYGVLHPEILSTFYYPGGTLPYTIPYKTDVDQGGFLLPMVRLKYSGALNYLPVELASLSANRNTDGSVSITWKTTNEVNAARYEVIRSASTPVGSLLAKNELTGANYAVIDRLAPALLSTYHLDEIDLNGERRTLGTVEVGPTGFDGLTLSYFPNPASNTLSVAGSQMMDVVELVDMLGRTVQELNPRSQTVDINLTDVPNGSYWLIASSGGKFVRSQISVIH